MLLSLLSVTNHRCNPLHCPFCRDEDTKVIDSRLMADGGQIRRRRQCLSCHERFTTYEIAELLMPRVIKQDGSREPFDDDKLRAGLNRALEKRPVSTESLETAINYIKHSLRSTGERELASQVIGQKVMTRGGVSLDLWQVTNETANVQVAMQLCREQQAPDHSHCYGQSFHR